MKQQKKCQTYWTYSSVCTKLYDFYGATVVPLIKMYSPTTGSSVRTIQPASSPRPRTCRGRTGCPLWCRPSSPSSSTALPSGCTWSRTPPATTWSYSGTCSVANSTHRHIYTRKHSTDKHTLIGQTPLPKSRIIRAWYSQHLRFGCSRSVLLPSRNNMIFYRGFGQEVK